jgi:TRAP-type mannitol/chloroaromatic compound transport system permease small subunit
MSWTWVVLMVVIIFNVVMRYLFNQGRIEFEELQWPLYAIGWLFGLSYCFIADDHVRVDLIHDRLSLKAQTWIELLGIVFLLIPFLTLVLLYAVPFILYSWELGEVSDAPGGLPYRWAIKSVLFIGFGLLALAALSRLSRVCALLFLRQSSSFILAETK